VIPLPFLSVDISRQTAPHVVLYTPGFLFNRTPLVWIHSNRIEVNGAAEFEQILIGFNEQCLVTALVEMATSVMVQVIGGGVRQY
jgi:hypothetical protein